MTERPTKAFLESLTCGQLVRVSRIGGDVTGRVSAIKPRLVYVRIGKETRRFMREDGGAFQSPSLASKSYLLPIKEADHG